MTRRSYKTSTGRMYVTPASRIGKDCEGIVEACSFCNAGTEPSTVTLTLTGSLTTADSCTGLCELLSGSYILPAVSPCVWRAQIHDGGVGCKLWLDYTFADQGGGNAVHAVFLTNDGLGFGSATKITWASSSFAYPIDCSAISATASYVSRIGSMHCNAAPGTTWAIVS